MRSLLAIGIFLISGCSGSADWTAFVYPDIENIPYADKVQNYTFGNYRTFEECQIAAIDRVRTNYASSQRQGDYDCGFKCSQRNDFGSLLICKETRK